MTRSLSSPKLAINLSAAVRNTLDDGTIASAQLLATVTENMADGVGAGLVNRGWQWKHSTGSAKTISSGGTLVIDLYDFAGLDAGAGAGNDPVGQALAVEQVVAILIKNENAQGDAGQLEVEPDATAGWAPIGTHTVATGGALGGGGCLLKFNPGSAGFDVSDASSHRIKLTANGGDCNVSIWVLGRHDDETSSSSSSSSDSSSSSSSSSTSSTSSSSSSDSSTSSSSSSP